MNAITDAFKKAKDIVTSIPREIEDANWFSLPNWMRRYKDAEHHTRAQECARRVRQIEDGFLKPASRGTVNVAE